MEIRLRLSLQLKGEILFFSLSTALLLFYCSPFHGMMRAYPSVAGGGDTIINKQILLDRACRVTKGLINNEQGISDQGGGVWVRSPPYTR